MSSLSSIEKVKLEKLFGMSSGYVLSFSNTTFQNFILENTGVDIYDNKYNWGTGSKANRLRAFWNLERNPSVGKLLLQLLEYWKVEREIENQVITLAEQSLYDESHKIAERLILDKPPQDLAEERANVQNKQEKILNKTRQLNVLLSTFDDLSKSTNRQKSGFLLQDLLSKLFSIHEIPTTKSFQRNEGGEQIDGAFTYNSWHYLVECKWTKKLVDIRELDSLLGKVNRGGRQAMGLFLSIEGWSEHVPPLLKQNPDKCIILMDGCDLRYVLSEAIELEKLLDRKIAKLNNDSEPFLSSVEMLHELNE